MKKISRRDVMKGLAAAGAGAAVSLASGSAVFGVSKTISGAGWGNTGPIATIHTVDFDVEGVAPDLERIETALTWCRHYGVLEGYIVWLVNRITWLPYETGDRRVSSTGTFWGRVGDSAPGVMTIIMTSVREAGMSSFRQVVVEGSGSGGLEGISGFGVKCPQPPEAPPGFNYYVNYQFRFRSASDTAWLANP